MLSNAEHRPIGEGTLVGRHQVFLVQGNLQGDSGEPGALMEQRVFVAANDDALRDYLMHHPQEGGFIPLGWATLAEYEDAARLIRVSLKGEGGCFVTVVPAT